jgi:hypothetical protein
MVNIKEIKKIKYYSYANTIQNLWIKYNTRKIRNKKILLFIYKFLIFLVFNTFTEKIQKFWRLKHFNLKLINTECPISLRPLKTLNYYERVLLYNNDGRFYGYELNSLFENYIAGNNIICPCTRRKLTNKEIVMIINKKYKKNVACNYKENDIIVNQFKEIIYIKMKKQLEIQETLDIIIEDIEFLIEDTHINIRRTCWGDRYQNYLNNDFLSYFSICNRFDILYPFVNIQCVKEIRKRTVERLNNYIENYENNNFETGELQHELYLSFCLWKKEKELLKINITRALLFCEFKNKTNYLASFTNQLTYDILEQKTY